ncbi:MAG TPA: hypothetical protein VFI96_07915, partial [Longimicrobiaceae bacterium]|nr:hypothetical protein [Longimicrobiaceae bacterium]
RELFDRYTGMTFDAVAPAAALSDLAVSLILQPERAARLVEQHALDSSLPGLSGVVDRLEGASFGARTTDDYEAAVSRATQRSVADGLMGLAFDAPMPEVRAMATLKLTELRDRLQNEDAKGSEAERAHRLALAQEIGRFLERPYAPSRRTPELDLPPGAPIGAEAPAWIP